MAADVISADFVAMYLMTRGGVEASLAFYYIIHRRNRRAVRKYELCVIYLRAAVCGGRPAGTAGCV